MVDAWDSPTAMLNAGCRSGASWLPAECDVSIRPGWFYHATEDDKVRTPENLMDLYFKSVGRGASFLLNLPPDRRGLVHENDVQSLQGFKARLDEIFGENLAKGATCSASNTRGGLEDFVPAAVIDGESKTYWSTDDDVTTPELVLELQGSVTFNIISLREHLPLGQRVDRFAIDVEVDGDWKEWCCADAIGNRRLIRGDSCTTGRVRLRIVDSPVCPAISEFALHFDTKAGE
jgi:alpha-L-fucosidase